MIYAKNQYDKGRDEPQDRPGAPGHADITFTLDTYSHMMPSMQDKVPEKLDELVTLVDVGDQIKAKNDLPVKRTGVHIPGNGN